MEKTPCASSKPVMLGQVLNIIFPRICPLCGLALVEAGRGQEEGAEEAGGVGGVGEIGGAGGFCRACEGTIKKIQGPVCTICGKPFASSATAAGGQDHPCGQCMQGAPPFLKARSAVFYEEGVKDAIISFKYHGRLTLARPLGRMTADALPGLVEATPLLPEVPFDVVMPVPLHKERLKQRGFNQSLLLAREVAGALGLSVDYKSLKRIRPTAPQAELKSDERRKNVRGAFEVKSPARVRAKKVLLIDDIYTTGATVGECARVLKKEKCKVFVLTLARPGGV